MYKGYAGGTPVDLLVGCQIGVNCPGVMLANSQELMGRSFLARQVPWLTIHRRPMPEHPFGTVAYLWADALFTVPLPGQIILPSLMNLCSEISGHSLVFSPLFRRRPESSVIYPLTRGGIWPPAQAGATNTPPQGPLMLLPQALMNLCDTSGTY